jgi:hypothetical protein
VHRTSSHDKTGRHCLADKTNRNINIPRTSAYWLKDAASRGMKHICWDGCLFSNKVLEAMIRVDNAL